MYVVSFFCCKCEYKKSQIVEYFLCCCKGRYKSIVLASITKRATCLYRKKKMHKI